MTNVELMIKNLGRLLVDPKFVSDRQTRKFIADMAAHTDNGKETRHLAEFQIKWIAQLHADYHQA